MIAAAFWALLAIIALLVTAVIAFAVTPVRLRCILRSEPKGQAVVVARLLAGLMPPIRVFDSSRRAAKRQRRVKKRPGTPRFRHVSHVVQQVPELLTDLLQRIRVRRLVVDADIGLGDPADTGQVFGLLQAARYAVPAAPGVSVNIRPDFEERRLSGWLAAEMSFIPVTFLPPVLRFVWRAFGPRR